MRLSVTTFMLVATFLGDRLDEEDVALLRRHDLPAFRVAQRDRLELLVLVEDDHRRDAVGRKNLNDVVFLVGDAGDPGDRASRLSASVRRTTGDRPDASKQGRHEGNERSSPLPWRDRLLVAAIRVDLEAKRVLETPFVADRAYRCSGSERPRSNDARSIPCRSFRWSRSARSRCWRSGRSPT